MSSLVQFVLLLVFAGIDISCTAFPSEIIIGGIFDEDDGGSYSASEQAFNMAINDVNNDGSILSGVTLKGIANTTRSLDIQQSVESVCDQIDRRVVAVIGPIRSTPVKATNYICSGIGLPQLSYAATYPTLFTAHQQYPYLIRTSSTGDTQSEAIMELMEYHKWNKAAMLTSTDDYGAVSLEHIRQSSYERKISIVTTESFPALSDPSLIDYSRPLLSIKSLDVQLVILNCPGKYAKRLLDVASSLGMMTNEWVWIVSDAIVTEANLYNISDAPPTHLRGILGIIPSFSQAKNRAAFEAKWIGRGGKLPISVYSYKVYDAVWILARALHSMSVDGDSLTPPALSCMQCDKQSITKWADGKKLLEKIKSVQFIGELHPVEFSNEGSVLYEAYDFVNLQKSGFQKIGYWDNSSGLLLNTSDILWLGESASAPQALSISLKNKTFSIVTVKERPFIMRKTGNYTGNDVWEGYCIDMLQEIAKELGFNYVLHNSYDGKFGGKNADTQEWDGMVNELVTGKADMAVAAFTISSIRQEAIDFTKPYIDLGLTVIIKKETGKKGLLDFMDPFTNEVWFLLFCSTIYVGVVLTICSKLSPYGFYGMEVQTDGKTLTDAQSDELKTNKNNMNLDEAAWFSMGSLLGQGTENQPKSVSGKVVAAVWWMAGTIFVATYTANLAAFITVQKSAIHVHSLEDLAGQSVVKYGTVESSQPSQFFENSDIPLYQKIWSTMKSDGNLMDSSADAFAEVQEGHFAFIWDSAVLEYAINQEPCNTFILNDLFSPLGYGIGLPLNSPYEDVITNAILQLRENGFLDRLKTKWFVQKGTCGFESEKKSGAIIVYLEDVIGVYFLVAGGVVLGLIALMLEWIYFTRKLVKNSESKYLTFGEVLKARFKLVCRDITRRWISRRSFKHDGRHNDDVD